MQAGNLGWRDANRLPALFVDALKGLRVVEFTHMVMGPTCGMVLADLGAEVVKVEPLEGDATRRLLGSGSGFYGLFNRNKHSLAVDVKAGVEEFMAGDGPMVLDIRISRNVRSVAYSRLWFGEDV